MYKISLVCAKKKHENLSKEKIKMLQRDRHTVTLRRDTLFWFILSILSMLPIPCQHYISIEWYKDE